MADDPAEFLLGAGQETGDVLEDEHRNVERVAEPHEPRALHGRVDVEHAGQVHGLVGDDADRAAAQAHEADDDVPGERRVHLEELPVVGDGAMNSAMSYGLFGSSGMKPSRSPVVRRPARGWTAGRIVEIVADGR